VAAAASSAGGSGGGGGASGGPRPRAIMALLEDAEAYLVDLAEAAPGALAPADEVLRQAAATALREVRAEVAMARAAGAAGAAGATAAATGATF
jgi:hypothetical protein